MSEVVYDLCVVGAGMIGSSAARHASSDPAVSVCLVGPSEPQVQVRTLEDPRDIYGSHYDEGRITWSCDPDPVMAILAQESIRRYRQIERDSGIKFYTEVGSLVAGMADSEYMKNMTRNARLQGVSLTFLGPAQLSERFPYLKVAGNDVGALESRDAGYLSPRKLVEAEIAIAQKQGCTVIDDVVNSIERMMRDGSYVMRIVTEKGREVISKAVLLATGAFTNSRQLLPSGLRPEQRLRGITVVLVEVDVEQAARLRTMPPVIYRGAGHPELHRFPTDAGSSVSLYMLPPILYPNGRYYIKLGHFYSHMAHLLKTSAELKRWFVAGSPTTTENTAKLIKSLLRGVDLKAWHGDYCVITVTPINKPYIDKVHAQLGVALGGNGHAARSCDEIGRLAADMMFGKWNSKIPREVFKCRFEGANKQTLLTSKM